MREELDRKLCEDFPCLYKDRTAPMSQTAMCWGFPGDGWEPLLRELSSKLEPLIKAEYEKDPEIEKAGYYKASQVKEKFGTLCFYMTAETDEMTELIREAEDKSAVTCEDCGKPGKLRGDGWFYTACHEHAKVEDKDSLELLEHKYIEKEKQNG